MHGDADDVLGERDFAGLDIAGFDQTGYGVLGIEHAVPDQRLHGLEAAAAGDHARWSRNAVRGEWRSTSPTGRFAETWARRERGAGGQRER